MSWFFIALGAPFLWAIVNIADQYLVKKTEDENSPVGSLIIFSSIVGIFISIFILIFSKDAFLVPNIDKYILIISGIVNISWVTLYLYALSYDNVSVVYPWFLTVPIFSYILGYIFLGETLTQSQILGMFIVIFGGLIISLDSQHLFNGKIKIKLKATLFMLSAALLMSVQYLLFKFVTVQDSFWTSSFWQYIGLGISGIIIFTFVKKYREGFLSVLKNSGKTILSINIGSELITIAGNTLFNFSLLMAPIALVALMEPIQSVIVFIIATLGTIFFPKIIKEDISPKIILHKIVAMTIMIVGSIIIFV